MRMRDDDDDTKEDESRKFFQATGFHFYFFLPSFVFQLSLSLSLFPSSYFFSFSSLLCSHSIFLLNSRILSYLIILSHPSSFMEKEGNPSLL